MYSGKVIGMGNIICSMNHFHRLDELPRDNDILLIDIEIDTKHQLSETTHFAFAFTKKRNVILLATNK
ncbi:hypothetical protein I2483_01105 [Sporosarcina sp. E16_3]|uniref:hypothetical protein n=1 Tax=Sporosarcina sp. E16_3 TaxID=2789293 RepID=UPI001A90D63B|nr:hypothetical protein [Sporosarcina sp. E16_3]MBO0600246.1 hypothetical protein [Sporosarcina sp. E16_3]